MVQSDFTYLNTLAPRDVRMTELFGTEHHRKMCCVALMNGHGQ